MVLFVLQQECWITQYLPYLEYWRYNPSAYLEVYLLLSEPRLRVGVYGLTFTSSPKC